MLWYSRGMSREEQEHRPTPPSESSQGQAAYVRAARFSGEKPAGRAYRKAQDLLFRAPDCELSAYRFHLDRIWHVAVLGQPPAEHLDQWIRKILSRGEPASLPEELVLELERRRTLATELGPWVERHQRPGPDL